MTGESHLESILESDLEIRVGGVADHGSVIALAGEALGWVPGEPNAELFRWKHLDNPFGASPLWLAFVGGELAGFRTFLRWEFGHADGEPRRAVRAVDTATRPAYQGHGIFTRLTRFAVEEERAAGTDFVFNTPNDRSRPGYLKMGWEIVGRVPVSVAVRGPASTWRMARARVPADKWSMDVAVGERAAEVFVDAGGLDELLASQPPCRGLRTQRTPTFVRWRYGLDALHYRVLLRTSRVEDGFAVFRVRRRGAAVEATVCDVVAPDGDARLTRSLAASVMKRVQPDYAIRVTPRTDRAIRRPVDGRWVGLPRQGPILTWRALARTGKPELSAWDLRLGDIELL